MKLPDLAARIHAERIRLHREGLSADIEDYSARICEDDIKGIFMRVTIQFADGGRLTLDTLEPQDMLTEAIARLRPH